MQLGTSDNRGRNPTAFKPSLHYSTKTGIDYVSFENPGYLPVRNIFKDRGFKMAAVPVDKDGIKIEMLPANIRSTVYVSPSNQFHILYANSKTLFTARLGLWQQ